jgi:nitrite transporter NirC
MNKQYTVRKNIDILLKGILAGIAISFGGFLCLRLNALSGNNILGSFLFSFGLILICNFNFNLYTGKICYLFDDINYNCSSKIVIKNIFSKVITYTIILLGNLLGTLIFANLLKLVMVDNSINNTLMETLKNSVETKINYSWYQMIGLSFFCGMLVYIAVEGFKKIENQFGKYVVLILAIGGFIIMGFEHSIANMFYYFLSGNYSLIALLSLLLCVIGNSLGGLFIPLINKILIMLL